LKIVVHCVYFPPEVGGLESHVHYLCRGLVARGHEVTVVTSLSRPGLATHEVMDGIRVHRTPLPARKPWGWLAHALGSTRRTRAAVAGADVVHAQAFPSLLPCAVALAGSSTPLVCTLHTSHFLRLAASRILARPLGKLVELGDYNFAASKEIADMGESLGPTIRVEVLVNGVDTGIFRPVEPVLPPSGDCRRLVVPRRLFPKNGVEYFVRALPAIVAGADVDAIVIGDGPERERLEALAADLGVAGRIRFLGARPHAEMPGLLCSGDLAVFPSLVEATSVAALECMACGLPVAAYFCLLALIVFATQFAGTGFTRNVPLPAGTGDVTYGLLFEKIILPVAKAYRPQLMLVSAGVDAYMEDPLAGMRVTPDGFASMARYLKILADTVCQGRMVLVLEGGYHLEGLQESVLRVLDQLRGQPGPIASSDRSDLFEAVLARARTHFGDHWKF